MYVVMPHMFGCPLYVWMSPYVWMAPCMFGCPHMSPCMFGHPHMFGCPLYAWKPPIFLDDVCMPPVQTQHKERMFCQTKGVSICPYTLGCPLYIHKTKKACFVRLIGHLYAPIHLDAPYVWIPPVYLDAPSMFRCHHMFGCHLYIWTPPMFAVPIH